MPVEPRGQAIRVMINLVNRKREEPPGCGGGRQLSLDGTSRVTGDCHARICERLGVKSPGATRRRPAMVVPTATVDRTGPPLSENTLCPLPPMRTKSVNTALLSRSNHQLQTRGSKMKACFGA